jgi:hypothetical protein
MVPADRRAGDVIAMPGWQGAGHQRLEVRRSAMSINTSSIVYAYADRFVGERPRRGGIEVPCRDVRVKKRAMAKTALGAAFVGLATAKRIRLSLGERRGLMGLRKRSTVFVEATGTAASSYGLEGSILASLSDRRDANAVPKIVERMLSLSEDPWGDVIARIEEGMLEQGLLVEGERGKAATFFLGKRLEPDCQRIGALEREATLAEQTLDGFRQANPAIYEQLLKDVQKGIRARLDVDVDVDFD